MKINDKYVFFWNGIYSQWHMADMTIDGKTFNCCEQYMMYRKALLFGDTEIANEIMETKNPKEQKALGRKIQGFDKAIWDKNSLAIVYRGNFEKFSQNPELKKQLLETGDRFLVEASPVDNIYGIGLADDAKGVEDPSNWKGLNILGSIITMVKNELR
jgi:ribA/ribD-fused uncharacterized protein